MLGALWAGHARALGTTQADGFIFAAILSAFGLLALTTGIWLLFDENVAKPIERLAAELRSRAHASVATGLDPAAARYLGDLPPAADAMTRALSRSTLDTAAHVAAETERQRLTDLLTELPVAMILACPNGRIVLYDGQTAEVLTQQGIPRLGAALTDYFAAPCLASATRRMHKSGREVVFAAEGADGRQSYDARMKPMDGGGYMLTIDAAHAQIAPEAARPLTYDFDLLDRDVAAAVEDTPLTALTYAVFDTETTGLLPHKDEIVQIGAVRVVNGRIVEAERMDQLVDPGRPIPPPSTAVHHVTDAMVRGQPEIAEAGPRFHAFAGGSVIVAHNAPFDMAFLHRHKARMGVAWDHPILDTVLLSAVLFGASQAHRLDALSARLDVAIRPELRHTALGDACATAEVLVRMLPMLVARGLTTFGAVLAETRRHGRLLENLN